MRLKTIKLAGFKSFVDPVSIHLPGNLCAVVGPNGCGKSNIIDAVRWVMGESSARQLRGDSMSDVIFNGSGSRQPVGQASIELVFDNQDGGIGGQYASYAEIAVRRSVAREGRSEYLLNGGKCRRRDITDIFLGTGLGSRSYAIIEQGMISRLVESRPEELRVFIEEAAGISRYKERRRETESRMQRTLENLERLTDLRDELKRQLQHLRHQADAAEKYRACKAEERTLKAQFLAMQWQGLEERLGECGQGLGEAELGLERVNSERGKVDAALERHRADHARATERFNSVQSRCYSLGAEVARSQQSIEHQRERGRQLTLDLEQAAVGCREASEQLASDRERQRQWQSQLAAAEPELRRLRAAESDSGDGLRAAEECVQAWQHEWDEFNLRAARPRQQVEVQQTRIEHLEGVLRRLRERLASLEQARRELEAEPADSPPAELAERLAAGERGIRERERRVAALLAEVNACRERGARLSEELDEARGELQGMRGRHASLETLQQAALAQGEGVDAWLRSQRLERRPRLLERMRVEPRWRLAVAAVLGDCLQAVCVERIERLEAALRQPPAGALALLDGAARDEPPAESLAAKVGGWDCRPLLGAVLTAEDLGDALRRRGSLQPHQSLITPEGIWLGPNWLRVPGGAAGEDGVIARREELESLGADIRRAETRCQQLAGSLDEAAASLRQLETRHHAAQASLQAETRELAEAGARLGAARARLEQAGERREELAGEIGEVRRQLESEGRALDEARRLLAEAAEAARADAGHREALLARRETLQEARQQAQLQARADRDAAHQAAMRGQSLQSRLDGMQQSIERSAEHVERLSNRKCGLEESLRGNDEPLADMQRRLDGQLGQRLQAEGELAEARREVEEIDRRMRDAEGQRLELERHAQTARDELEQKKLERQTLRVRQETLERQLGEAGRELEELLRDMPERASEERWQSLLEEVAGRIARLGPINLAAIEEFARQAERKRYLDAQNEELEAALETLRAAIRKIDGETRNRFRDTFDQINISLGELFPKVFGGGSARLEMTGDSLLDTGITIVARPPGKKNSTIHLLSGGEKALTAIALVFSIFRLNPAPFCLLDEVDAPLDDANSERYSRMLRELSAQVQFVFITHNKITMEMAEQLVGVTMQEPGVSRLVTVDVEEAERAAS